MNLDPDFLIQYNGQNLTPSVISWKLSHSDSDTSSLTVDLENQNSEYAGIFQPNTQISIIFGYSGNMMPLVTLDLLHIKPHFGVGVKRISLQAFDETHKLHGDSLKGGFKRGVNQVDAIKSIIRANTSCTPNVALTAPNMEQNHRMLVPGWPSARTILSYAAQCDSGKNPNPTQNIFNYTANTPDNFGGDNAVGCRRAPVQGQCRIDGRNPDATGPQNCIDDNRANNLQKAAAGNTIAASLELQGYPWIKAGDVCTIVGVDEWSGDWYAAHVDHSWNGEFLTHLSLRKGGVGEGACNASNPIVMGHALYSNEIYVGPRKTDGASVATFTYGDGGYVRSFDPNIDARKKHGPESVSGTSKLKDAVGKSEKPSYSNKVGK
jgi:hypothetical protein